MALTTILGGARSMAAPADIFSSPAPVMGGDPPKAADLRDGEASVSTQTGALTYSYPISVPPGRGGMAPRVSLNYSSQAPIYGTIASGWSLPIPAILEDPSQSPLRHRAPEVESFQGPEAALADDRYISTLAGNRPLVAVDELSPQELQSNVRQTYRAQNDSTYTRYESIKGESYFWRAWSSSGTVMTFGDVNRMGGCPAGLRFAPLTGEVDPFGNAIEYSYEWNPDLASCHIKEITWGTNPAAGITEPFARIAFTWEAPAIVNVSGTNYALGSTRTYRSGSLFVNGGERLTEITVTAFPPGGPVEHTRKITLAYDSSTESTNAPHAPVRQLKSIQESAWGATSAQPRVDLPPIEFTYAPASVQLTAGLATPTTPWSVGSINLKNLGWGYRHPLDDRWPSVEATMVDLDGDGLLDRLVNASWDTIPITECKAKWQRNLGPSSTGAIEFAPPSSVLDISLPRLKWAGGTSALVSGPTREACSLNGQVTTYANSHAGPSQCHDNSACLASANPDMAGRLFCYPGGTPCPTDLGGGGSDPYRTYLAYRWLDADGDGLVDLVAAIHGDMDTYDVGGGNGVVIGQQIPTPEPVPFGLGSWPQCPGPIDQCKSLGSCLDEAVWNCSTDPCSTNWDQVDACLSSAVAEGCFDMTTQFGSPSSGTPMQRVPYSRCEGLYPWFIFKNKGSGDFETTPIVKYQPVPLESEGGDSQIGGKSIFSQHQAALDFDGDGWLDAIEQDPKSNAPDTWWLWLGDGTGGFGPRRYYYPTRSHTNDDNRISASVPNLLDAQKLGLLDLNGDGLLDHWFDQGNDTANVAFNDGFGFRVRTSLRVGETNLNINPSYIATLHSTPSPTYEFGGGPVATGRSVMSRRPVDVDNDGRTDMVLFTGNGSATVRFNLGGEFLPARTYPGDASGAWRSILGSEVQGNEYENRKWELKADLMDLDGDGIAEVVTTEDGGANFRRSVPAGPPRLLTSIKNGRGATTFVTYASMHSPTVKQDPDARWWDGRPKATPASQWVVASLSVSDQFMPPPASTTTFLYEYPRHGQDDTGHYAFRGFETVTTTGPSGAKTKETYGYDPDWSGRLVSTTIIAAENPNAAVSVARTKYDAFSLFGNKLTTYHAIRTERFTCADGQTELQCAGTESPPVPGTPVASTLSTTTYVPRSSDTTSTVPLMWLESSTRTEHPSAAVDEPRVVTSTFTLAAGGQMYRVRPDTILSQVEKNGVVETFAKSRIVWDTAAPAYARKLRQEVWTEDSPNPSSTTTFNYNELTGNLDSVTTPRGHTTSYAYDARKLFVAAETPSLPAHYREFKYEYGTGTKTETIGPNVAACHSTSSCVLGGGQLSREQSKIVVDGLGRMLERWETVTVTNATGQVVYEPRLLGSASYVDAASAIPTSVTQREVIADSPVAQVKEVRTTLDGHGRPTSVTELAPDGTALASTTNVYGTDGTLTAVTVPNPAADGSSVTYQYTYDSLGRARTMRRPGGTTGADMFYETTPALGVTTRAREVTNDSAMRAETRRTVDADGRLIKVEEKIAEEGGEASAWATTHYQYDAANNVTQIRDPEDHVTTMTHDLAGHRKTITRGGRTWSFEYDEDGNLSSETAPCAAPIQPTCLAQSLTTFVYDPVGRLVVKNLAPRELTDSDRALFGAAQETFTWDEGSNARGRLSQWKSLGPNAELVQDQTFTYDAQGRPTSATMAFNAAGYAATRSHQQSYLLSGRPLRTTYGDQAMNGAQTTVSEIAYDVRGLPASVSISTNNGTTFRPPISVSRNVAGLVTSVSYPSASSPTMVQAQSLWVYDTFGRVTSQTVKKGAMLTQAAKQSMTYFGNDDIKNLTTYFGTTAKPLAFTYDYRHQLKTAIASPSSYFYASYSYGPAGRLTHATVDQALSPNGSEVQSRDFEYWYTETDPELITGLGGSLPYGDHPADYTYDLSGNQLTRKELGSRWSYLYDGKNQLRRATKWTNNVLQGSEEYWYDSTGTRTHVVKRDEDGRITKTIWYDGAAEAHYRAPPPWNNAAVTRVYTHVALGTPVVRIDRTGDNATTTEYQFHGLANNTLTTIAASNGTINTTFNYGPFGEVLESTNGGGFTNGIATHKRRLNDKVIDDLTGLSYYGARYYDRLLLNWTQMDPLYLRAPDLGKQSTPRRSNLGVFSLNNPIRYMDPDGRDSRNNLSGVHWNEQFNEDRRSRVYAAGGDDITETIVEAAYFRWLMNPFRGGGGSTPDGRTTADNACDGIRSVCDDMSPEDIRALYRRLPDDLGSARTIEMDGTQSTLDAAGVAGLASMFAAIGVASPFVATVVGYIFARNHGDVALNTVLGGCSVGRSRFKPVQKYEVGTADMLYARSVVGDALDIHHVGQAAVMELSVKGYVRGVGPAIALPRAEHGIVPTLKAQKMLPRSLLARDIWNLKRYTKAPTKALQDLIKLNKSTYPKDF